MDDIFDDISESESDKKDDNISINSLSAPKQLGRTQEEVDQAHAIDENLFKDIDMNYDATDIRERAKYIPLRLTYEERKLFRLVNSCITISDYTNEVDSASHKSVSKRRHLQLQQITAFLTGIIVGLDYAKGQSVLEDRNFSEYEDLLQSLFEIARRYKVMNPEKMRGEYGKLIFLLQDATSADIQALLGINLNKPLRTVYSFLEEHNGLALLGHKWIHHATKEVLAGKGVSKSEIATQIQRKERAIEEIASQFRTHRLSSDDIRTCLYSIGDNNSFLNSNRLPIEKCIGLLESYFSPASAGDTTSLEIREGTLGARLTHSHELQFNYVRQSLTLWSSIVQDMFRLWYLAELDLLDDTQPAELRNTGQGMQRVQQSPRVYKAIHEILHRNQRLLGNWVGSSVIHLGDHNVPNALVFIDKYTQVSRILGPLVKTLENLDTACEENEGLGRYMRSYGGIEKARSDVLVDFFTAAFDGSGGDNFFDAGSCIDGRLTSAWNWCSQLPNKPYYQLFKLTGFLSFDGEFDN